MNLHNWLYNILHDAELVEIFESKIMKYFPVNSHTEVYFFNDKVAQDLPVYKTYTFKHRNKTLNLNAVYDAPNKTFIVATYQYYETFNFITRLGCSLTAISIFMLLIYVALMAAGI
jgi:hypothetical protein